MCEVGRIDRMLSWRAAPSKNQGKNGSITRPHGTSLNPSLEGLSYNTGQYAIEPEKTIPLNSAQSGICLMTAFPDGRGLRVDKDQRSLRA